MAEAFGIAGSAFGTISLGLQLFQEISQYLDSVEGRDEDLERARNYARMFRSSLISLRVWASNAGISDNDAEDAINQCQTSCAVAIDNLLRVVDELKGPDIISNSRTSKAKGLYVKLKYPFKKQHLEKLEKQLFDTSTALQVALNVLQVKSDYIIQSSILGIRQTVNDFQLAAKNDQVSLQQALQSLHKDVRGIHARLPEPDEPNHGVQPAGGVEKTLESTFDSALGLQDPASPTSISRIKSTKYQNGDVWTMKSFCCCRTKCTRRERWQWGPFIIEKERSFTDYHLPGCPMSTPQPLKQQTKRTLKLPIPTGGRVASQFSVFITAGTGGIGFGQSLAWVATVDTDLSPSFRIIKGALRYPGLSTSGDRENLFFSCYRRLRWCFDNRRASITDVDQHGGSILDWVMGISWSLESGESIFPDDVLPFFCMLAQLTNLKSGRDSSPPLAQLSQNALTPDSAMTGEAITSLLSRCDETAGQDCIYESSYWSLQQRFDLVKKYPRIADYLEFGRLSRLILHEDEDGVRNYLQRYPSSIKEINYLGQSPIHLAVQTQNVATLQILLNYTDSKILNIKDNNDHCAVEHAADALFHAGRSEAKDGSDSCHGCIVLDVLLQSESALFTSSVRQAFHLPTEHDVLPCMKSQKNIIRSLASRRKRLQVLAQRELSLPERQELRICQAGILDQNAAQVQEHLEGRACHVPAYLRVYDDAKGPEDARSIYTLICHPEVAEYALQAGFHLPETIFDDVFCLLVQWMSSSRSWPRHQDFLLSSYICWLVDHGGDLLSPVPASGGRTTAAHYFMAYLGGSRYSYMRGNHPPLSSKGLPTILAEDNVDDCQCWCSPKGCTPLTKFIAAMECEYTWSEPWEAPEVALQQLEYLSSLFSEVGCELVKQPWIDSAIVRYFTFSILGLRHTCCRFDDSYDCRWKVSGPLSAEDRQEIEEEECSRLELFETLVMEFESERRNYGDLLSFARDYWAPKMGVVDKEFASCLLTESQRRPAEQVGVIWGGYGPRTPPRLHMIERRIKQGWKDMSQLERELIQLDEIAIDPERPIFR